jgi:hypothetical protein
MQAQIPKLSVPPQVAATWGEEKPQDFHAKDAYGIGYCRIYQYVGGPKAGEWFWCARRHLNLGTGTAPSAREGGTSGRDGPVSLVRH